MKPGKISFFILLFFLNSFTSIFAEEKIVTVPLVNLENLEPSFESEDSETQNTLNKESYSLKEKKN